MPRDTHWYFPVVALMLIPVGSLSLSLTGCITTPNRIFRADIVGESKGGAELWAENCTRCHTNRPATVYSDAQWDVAMHHMRVRANLTPVEHRKIAEFLKSAN